MLVASLYCFTVLGSLGLCPSAVERETSTPARGKEIIKSAMFTCRSGAGGVGAREGVRGMVRQGSTTSTPPVRGAGKAHVELDARPDLARGEGP